MENRRKYESPRRRSLQKGNSDLTASPSTTQAILLRGQWKGQVGGGRATLFTQYHNH